MTGISIGEGRRDGRLQVLPSIPNNHFAKIWTEQGLSFLAGEHARVHEQMIGYGQNGVVTDLTVLKGGHFLYQLVGERGRMFVKSDRITHSPTAEEILITETQSLYPLTYVSPNGRYALYGMRKEGGDICNWRILDIYNKTDLEDGFPELEGLIFPNIRWDRESKGFYYTGATEEGRALLYYSLEKRQAIEIYKHSEKDNLTYVASPIDSNRLVVVMYEISSGNKEVVVVNTADNSANSLLTTLYGNSYFLGERRGTLFFYRTTEGGSAGVVAVRSSGEKLKARRIGLRNIDRNTYLKEAVMTGDRLIFRCVKRYGLQFRQGICVFDTNGNKIEEIVLAQNHTIEPFSLVGADEDTIFCRVQTVPFVAPFRWCRLSISERRVTVEEKVSDDVALSNVSVNLVWYKSTDGVSVPMFIVRKRGTAEGETPTYLSTYGGFGLGGEPAFFPSLRWWIEQGGIFAYPCVRGGGRPDISGAGSEWHLAGKGRNRESTFNDFVSAARYLIENGYTSPKRLAFGGTSHGGLVALVSALRNPELCAACVVENPLTDLLGMRQLNPTGLIWREEYGDPQNRSDRIYMNRHSPVEIVARLSDNDINSIPPILVIVGRGDDRVGVGHGRLLIEQLKARSMTGRDTGGQRLDRFHYIELKRIGHCVASLNQALSIASLRWAFLRKTLKL